MQSLKWGILGAAEIARTCMIPAMKQSGSTELYAIASRTLDTALQLQAHHGFRKAYGTYQELLADPEVDAVYLPLPNSLHKEWVLKAATAGKHILCEKPLAASSTDVLEMFDACERAQVCLMEGFAYLHSPLIQSVRSELEAGTIGVAGLIEAVFFSPGYPDDNITVRRDTCGGALFDIGCYNLSIMHYLYDLEPISVRAVSHFSHLGTDDFTAAWLDFGDGRTGAMMTGIGSPQRADRFVVHGSKGSIEVMLPYNVAGRVSYNIRTEAGNRICPITLDLDDNYRLELDHLNQCILNGSKPHLDRAFSLRQARIMDRVVAQTGYWEQGTC